MKTTIFAKKEQVGPQGEIKQSWYCVDANGKTLGRICTQIAKVLQGKHKPIYTPHVDTGDYVIVINAEKIKLSGKKWTDKMYHHHTGYPGGLRSTSAETLLEKNPVALIENAVKGMLPKNQLNRYAFLKLKVYAGPDHPHQGTSPQPLEV